MGSLLAVARESGMTFSLVRFWLLLGRSLSGLRLWAPLTKRPFLRQLSLAWNCFPENMHLHDFSFPSRDADPMVWGGPGVSVCVQTPGLRWPAQMACDHAWRQLLCFSLSLPGILAFLSDC